MSMTNHSVKYTEALKVASKQGWRFTTAFPRSNILYSTMMLSGFKWDFVGKAWVKRHHPYVFLGEAS